VSLTECKPFHVEWQPETILLADIVLFGSSSRVTVIRDRGGVRSVF